MSTTVKRVALALWRKGGELGLDIGEDDAPDLARAAIAAMQENWDEKTENFRRAYFAMVREAWRNLPERIADRFPDHGRLRKWALIKAGYANEQDLVCESVADALRFTNYLTKVQPHSVVTCKANVIKIWTAKSQRRGAMNPEEFKDSANAVLDLLSEIIGIKVRELRRNAGKAA
jgi:hypothetical protein